MVAAAKTSEDRCGAQFYLGEWYLLRDNRRASIAAYRKALDSCPKGFNEYYGAVAELKRLRNY
jgi:hypothetical protein